VFRIMPVRQDRLEQAMGIRKIRLEFDGMPERFGGTRRITLRHADQAKIGIGFGIVGPKPGHGLQCVGGAGPVPLRHECASQPVPGVGVARTKPSGRPQRFRRRGIIMSVQQERSKAAVGIDMVGLHPDGLTIRFGRAGQVAPVVQRVGESKVCVGIGRLELGGLPECITCPAEFLLQTGFRRPCRGRAVQGRAIRCLVVQRGRTA